MILKYELLKIKLTKYIPEIYKTLLRDIKDLSKWRDLPCLWIGGLGIIGMSVLPKFIYRFHVLPIKVIEDIFQKLTG